MTTKNLTGLNATVTHPHWGVPMSFHKIARAEHDLILNKSHIVFASYYNLSAAENGGEAMTHNTVILNEAMLADEATLLQAVIDMPDGMMTGGTVVTGTQGVSAEEV